MVTTKAREAGELPELWNLLALISCAWEPQAFSPGGQVWEFSLMSPSMNQQAICPPPRVLFSPAWAV